MNWILFAILGNLLIALVSIMDKYLLHSRISKPHIYAFYVALFSSFALGFVPFGFDYPGLQNVLISLVSGFFFIYGLVALYKAIQASEISRVYPLVVGTVIPIVTVIYATLFLNENLGIAGLIGVLLMIVGGFLISFKLPIQKKKFFKGFGYVLLSGFLQAVSLGLLKEVYNSLELANPGLGTENFINGFVWNRIGFFAAGLSLLAVPAYRKDIMNSFFSGKKEKKKAATTSALFLVNKVTAGVGSFLIVLAVNGGKVSVVNSLGVFQFAFVVFFAWILSKYYNHIYKEKLSSSDWLQKTVAVSMMASGLIIVSMGEKTHEIIIKFLKL